jgi:hypothetical protein
LVHLSLFKLNFFIDKILLNRNDAVKYFQMIVLQAGERPANGELCRSIFFKAPIFIG